MEKMLIVDGSNLLFQMFYGMPSRIINREGKQIQGVIGFVGALLKMIRSEKPDYVTVLFDGETSNPRREEDGDYKANRPDFSEMAEEETPFSQIPDIYRTLDYLSIPHAETVNCETDDWIAGYALQYGREYILTIASWDSDFFQLITDRVSVLRYRGEQSVRCDEAFIRRKWGISPRQYADFKSLTGDSSDNIRGADKVGPKTAAALLLRFGDLETVLMEYESIAKPSVRESIRENSDRLRKNYRLIHLLPCDELPFSPSEMRYRDIGMTTMQVLKAVGVQ